MKVMVIVKATADTEAGKLPTHEELTEMGRFNEELVNAGVMLAGDGLRPSSHGARVVFEGAKRHVVDGPFAETKELVAGFWIWQVRSLEEAVEWAKRCPNPTGAMGALEIRPFYEAGDFGEAFDEVLEAKEARLRDRLGQP